MGTILHDTSTPSLVTAIEENLYCFVLALRAWPRVEVHDDPQMRWAATDIPFGLFNSIMRTRLPSDAADQAIDRMMDKARARNVPISWWTGPSTCPADFNTRLERHGFIRDTAPGMALELGKLAEDRPKPAGLTVELALEPEDRAQWGFTSAAGFGADEAEANWLGEVWCDFLSCADRQTIIPYLGRLDGEPVATSMLMLGAGVAGIYAVATIPEARCKGIGAFMTALPLEHAKAMGYEVGILQASEMGVSVYRALGFHEYCRIYEYSWRPEPIPAAP